MRPMHPFPVGERPPPLHWAPPGRSRGGPYVSLPPFPPFQRPPPPPPPPGPSSLHFRRRPPFPFPQRHRRPHLVTSAHLSGIPKPQPAFQNGSNYSITQDTLEKGSETKGSFDCEVCDQCFPTDGALQLHLETHVKCQFDGCSYSAPPNLVSLHVKFQHKTGLFQKIPWNNSSEAIEKWRAERKKKYPTVENVERKMAELKEKTDRGEVIKDHTPKHKAKGKRRKRTERHLKRHKEKEQQQPVESSFISRIGSLTNLEEENLASKAESDEEWKEKIPPQKDESKVPLLLGKALAMISDVYGSGSDGEGEKTEKPNAPCESLSDDERPEEVSCVASTQPPIQPDNKREVRKRHLPNPRFPKRSHVPLKKMRKPTFLQMLLKDDIRKERNCLLQCIRFIRKTNFLKTLNDDNTV